MKVSYSQSSSLILLWLSPLFALAQDDGGVPSIDQCYENLKTSDADGDGKVRTDEFLAFVQLMASGSPDVLSTVSGLSSFSELDLSYKMNYGTLACLCQNPALGGDESMASICCVGDYAHVRVPTTTTDTDQAYLDEVCFVMNSQIYGITREPEAVEATEAPVVADEEPTTSTTTTTTEEEPATTTTTTTEGDTTTTEEEPTTTTTTAEEETTSSTTTTEEEPVAQDEEEQPVVVVSDEGDENGGDEPSEADITVYYPVFIKGGNLVENLYGNQASSRVELIAAMNIVARQVLDEMNDNTVTPMGVVRRERQMRQQQRSLELVTAEVKMPTVITDMKKIPCPDTVEVTSNDLCQNMTHVITLLNMDATADAASLALYQANLTKAIYSDSKLASEMEATNPDSNVLVMTSSSLMGGDSSAVTTPSSTGGGMSTWAVIGIIVGCLAAGTLAVSYCISSQREEEEEKKKELADKDNEEELA